MYLFFRSFYYNIFSNNSYSDIHTSDNLHTIADTKNPSKEHVTYKHYYLCLKLFKITFTDKTGSLLLRIFDYFAVMNLGLHFIHNQIKFFILSFSKHFFTYLTICECSLSVSSHKIFAIQ